MASFITKNFLDNEGLKAFWKLIKQYLEEYVNNNSNNGKPITWGDITDKPTVYGTAKSSSHKHTASFSDTEGHTHTFSGSEGTTDLVNDHTHSVNVKGSVTSSFTDIEGHTHTFSGSEGTTDLVNDHTHNVDFASQSAGDHQHTFTPAGSVTLSGSLNEGVLTITAEFNGNSLTTTLTGAHTHTVSGTSDAAGGHDHGFTPTGSVNNAKATGTVTSSIDLTPTTDAAGEHDHGFTPTGSVNNAKATGTVTVDNETAHTHNVEIAL